MLNSCNFIGRLGNDPEIKYLPSGGAVASISIACSEKWRDKETGQQKEKTEWIRCSAFGKLAEIMGEYLRKGALVYVSGKMQTRKYQDQSGQDRYSTEIVVSEMKMLGGKSDNQGVQQGEYQQPQQNRQPQKQNHQQSSQQRAPQPQQSYQQQPQHNEQSMDWDDSIPF